MILFKVHVEIWDKSAWPGCKGQALAKQVDELIFDKVGEVLQFFKCVYIEVKCRFFFTVIMNCKSFFLSRVKTRAIFECLGKDWSQG